MELDQRVQQVADALVGTAADLKEHATDEEINDQSFCILLDNLIFCCDQCNWWCEIDEMSEDNICLECSDA